MEIRPSYRFDVSCQISVPESIVAFHDSSDYETTVKNALSLGGDADTIACIAGGIAQAFYKEIPEYIVEEAMQKLTPDLRQVVNMFNDHYQCEYLYRIVKIFFNMLKDQKCS